MAPDVPSALPARARLCCVALALAAVSVSAAVGEASFAEARPASPVPREVAPGKWRDVGRVVAIGDLHGNYDGLVGLLQATRLADEELAWTGGSAHLVIAGDFLDRGTGGRAIMDLLRRLRVDSAAAGGRVHVLLGNHEAMNLMRDMRYVAPEAYADFAAEESDEERLAVREQWIGGVAPEANPEEARDAFDGEYPPGYFARLRAFDPEGEYGAWLLTLPAVVDIDGVVFVHGGLTAEFAALGVEEINRLVSADLAEHLEARRRLEEAGVVARWMDFGELRIAAARELDREAGSRRDRNGEDADSGLRAAASVFLRSAERTVLASEGPLWYRGSSWEDERIERAELERSLELLDASAMVVAHTPTGRRYITSRFHDRLYRLDHGIAQADEPLALVIERRGSGEREVLVVGAESQFAMRPLREPPTGALRFAPTTEAADAELEELLARGAVVESRELGRGSTRPRLLVLELEGERRRAIWKSIDEPGDERGDSYRHEVAAYRLDRLLGLGLVPVTVARRIDGEKGSLQIWVEEAVDRETADSYDLELFDGERARRQLARAPLFDALIGNRDRKPSDVLGLLGGDRVFLIDHSRAFSTEAELPEKSPGDGANAAADPELLAALGALDRRTLRRELGKLLESRQIGALLERRDALLEAAAN